MILAAAGCATPPSGIGNYHEVQSGVLYRGGAPTHAGLQRLKEQGIRTVIDLRSESRGDEQQAVERLGMRYVSIPCRAQNPTDAQMAQFLSIVMSPEAQPVFVHCHHGMDRTGTAVAMYRMIAGEWDPRRAVDELRRYQGFGHAVWFPQIPRYLFATQRASFIDALVAHHDDESRHPAE